MTESKIKSEVRKRLSKLGVAIYNNATGVATDDRGNRTRYGLCRGSSDLIGFIGPHGRGIVLEVKTPKGLHEHKLALARAMFKAENGDRLTKQEMRAYEQHLFVELMRSKGCVAGFVTSADEAEELAKA